MVAAGTVGLIAGSGRLPEVLAEAIKAQGRSLVVMSLADDPPPAAHLADARVRVDVNDLPRLMVVLAQHQVDELVFAGDVSRLIPIDRLAAAVRSVTGSGPQTPGQGLFQQGIALLAGFGITVRSPLDIRPDLATPAGILGARAPAADEWDDVGRGIAVARVLAGEEIGQTIAIRRGVVIAVEAADGTDATIARAGLFQPGVVIAKAARPHQDLRFDLPTAGLDTVQALRQARASVLALEAGRTLLLDREAAVASADEAGIAIVGVEMTGPGTSP